MKKQILFLLLIFTSITKAQSIKNTNISSIEEAKCTTKEKIIGVWYQEDTQFKEETIENEKGSLHITKPETELKIKKNNTYRYKSIMTLTFNINELKMYNAKVIIKQIGKGNWSLDCKHLLYKNLKNKIEYEIDEDIKKSEELYNMIMKIIKFYSKDSEIKKVDHQEIIEISKNIIKTNKKVYTRI